MKGNEDVDLSIEEIAMKKHALYVKRYSNGLSEQDRFLDGYEALDL